MESSSAEGDYRAVLFTTVNMSVQIRAKGNLKVREAAWHSNLILKPAGKVCSGAVSRTQASQGTRPFNLTFRTTNAGFSVDVFFFFTCLVREVGQKSTCPKSVFACP